MDEEQWKELDYLGFANYKVSTTGRVINISSGIEIFGFMSGGYKLIGFRSPTKQRVNISIHKLVAHSFIMYKGEYITSLEKATLENISVDHIDRNKLNNNFENLRWATRLEQSLNRTVHKKITPIVQFSIYGVLIKNWDDIQDIITANITYKISTIRECCRSKIKTAYGFVWKYVNHNIKPLEQLEGEIWKPLLDDRFENVFVSSLGRVKSKNRDPLYGHVSKNKGYTQIFMRDKNGKTYSLPAHRLIALTFLRIPNCEEIFVVNHKNGIRHDNRVENLEFITQKQNVQHAFDTGLTDMSKQHVSVIKIDAKTKEIIEKYDSVKRAAAKNNINHHANISAVCAGRRSICGGFFLG
jgi:hypothetical protein